MNFPSLLLKEAGLLASEKRGQRLLQGLFDAQPARGPYKVAQAGEVRAGPGRAGASLAIGVPGMRGWDRTKQAGPALRAGVSLANREEPGRAGISLAIAIDAGPLGRRHGPSLRRATGHCLDSAAGHRSQTSLGQRYWPQLGQRQRPSPLEELGAAPQAIVEHVHHVDPDAPVATTRGR